MGNHIFEVVMEGVLTGLENPRVTPNGATHYENILFEEDKLNNVVVPRELVRDLKASIGTKVRLAYVNHIHAETATRILTAIRHQDQTVSRMSENVSRSDAAGLVVTHTKTDYAIAAFILFAAYFIICRAVLAIVVLPDTVTNLLSVWEMSFVVAALLLGAQRCNNEWFSPSSPHKLKQALRHSSASFNT